MSWLIKQVSAELEKVRQSYVWVFQSVRRPQFLCLSFIYSFLSVGITHWKPLKAQDLQFHSSATSDKNGFPFSTNARKNPKLILIWPNLGHLSILELRRRNCVDWSSLYLVVASGIETEAKLGETNEALTFV
jgi:hypothetical protein